MKKEVLYIFVVFVFCTTLKAQERSGIYLGVNYYSASHTNPYVYVTGNELNPTSVQGFDDKTSQFYIPFGYASYSKEGFSEFSSYALHFLVVGALNLINPNKEYTITTDHTYSGDSWADGYVPVFDDISQTSQYWNYGTNKALEASYVENDLFRFAFATNKLTESIDMPVIAGVQGGVGGLGVHFAEVEKDHEPGDVNNDHSGLVNFNDAVDLYFGANIGYTTELTGHDLALVSVQYDWHYFIKGVSDNSQLKGNRLTVEVTYFPFDVRKGFLKNLFLKAFYKHNSIPYMKKFAEKIETTYTNTTLGLGVSYFIL